MRIAYADPPYIGYHRYYKADPRAAEVDHVALIAQLEREYDGWAVSCYSNSLRLLLPMCPESARVGAWVKPFCAGRKGISPKYAWEPVIFKPARKHLPSKHYPFAVDWVSSSPPMQAGLIGAKPVQFCWWLFTALHATPRDEFCDLFPGTGVVSRAWETWRRQIRLEIPA